jgi:hypothetical protein
MDFEVAPIAAEHIEAFHRVLDVVARERKYLAFLEVPPLEQAREFIMRNIAQNNVQLVAFAGGELIGWADVLPKDRPIIRMSECLALVFYPPSGARALELLSCMPHCTGRSSAAMYASS